MSAKVATIFGGNIKDVDPARVVKMMNAIGVAAAETAADPQDVIEGFKKGNAALAMANGKMAEGDLAAMLAVAVSGGIQPSKAGNAISNLVSKLIGGRSLTGKKAKDLDEAASMLGFGDRKKLADQSAADPTAVMLRIFKKMNEMSAQNKVRVAQLLGGQEWDDELTMMANSVTNMAETIKKTRTKVDLLDKASAEQLNSLRGRWNSVGTAFVLHFEKIGEGLEGNFRDLADWLLEHSAKIDNDKLTESVRRFADMIKRKLAPVIGLFGLVGDILSKIGDMITKLDEWFGGTIVEKAFKKIQSTAASIMPGLGGMPAGKIITDLLTGIVTEILKFGITKPDGNPGENPKVQKQSFLDDSKKAGQEFRKAAFLSNAPEDFRRNIIPASYTGSSGRSGSGFSYASNGRGISTYNGTPLHSAAPGAAIPNLLGNGGIIRRDKIPSFDGSGGSVASGGGSGGIVSPKKSFHGGGGSVAGKASAGASSGASVGSAGTGDAVGWAEKYKGMNEYTDNRVLASVLGGDVRGKSNAWCSRFVNRALAEAGGKGTGSAVANSFQRYGSAVKPSNVRRNDVLLQTHGRGYNQTGGHVGMATGETRMHNGRMQIRMIAGNDSDSVRERWIDADDPNLMVRRGNVGANVPQGITDAVPPSGMIQNVPPADAVSRGLTGPGMMRGGSGATIHINGNSHDPEALATLVQRRIDESVNWRTHDTASEYT